MPSLTLDQANRIIDGALAKAAQLGLKPLTVAVLDAGSVLVAFKRQDGSPNMRPEIAIGKAWGALGVGRSSRGLWRMAQERPAFVNALIAASDGRLIPVPGGVLIRDAGGLIVGAVGVSGDTSDRDEECAAAGIETVGLKPDTD
jgi:uncharacterized protein GlcG (DUF336 family)